MPPHPGLLEQLRRGSVAMPKMLQDAAGLKARGIDAPWSSPTLDARRQISRGAVARSLGAAQPPSGSFRALALLVSFSDKPAQVTGTYFDTLLFVQHPGSLRDYYHAVSYDALDIITVNLPGTIGWTAAPQTYAYYVNGTNGMGSYPHNSQKLVEDLVTLVNPVVDFSQYDNDHDGFVDALFVIHAGKGAEFTGSANDIWSHAWVTSSPRVVDGVSVFRYSIEPEYWETPGDMTIGVYAHELGHAAFGLPDLYDRTYSSEGLGDWSLMAGGSWNGPAPGGASPALPDAWCHIQMGYASATTVTTSVSGLACPAIETSPVAYKLWKNGNPLTQYFLMENRQRTGYDTYLPGDGLLVYHVDESVTTQNDSAWYPDHTTSGHYFAALEQADGDFWLEKGMNRGDGGDPFPGITNNHSLSVASHPGTLDYGYEQSGVRIQNISASGPAMTADVMVNADETALVLLTPDGGEKWVAGTSHPITWVSFNVMGTVTMELSTDDGSTWSVVGTTDAAQPASLTAGPQLSTTDAAVTLPDAAVFGPARVPGSSPWTVPRSPSAHCRVRLTSTSDASVRDSSRAPFTIVSDIPDLWSVQFNYNATSVTSANGNAGVVFIPTLREFWTSRWGSALLHRWQANGLLIAQFSVSGVSGVRGMTFDGWYVYASTNSTTISIIDPATRTMAGTIPAPLEARYITYDPAADGGAGGFWIGNYETDVTLISRAGITLQTIPYASLGVTLIYGAAIDTISGGGTHLWVWGQGSGSGSPQRIVQISLATGLPTGIEHDVIADIGAGNSGAIAGGLYVSAGIVDGEATIGGVLQGTSDRLFGYHLADLAPRVRLKVFLQGPYVAAGDSMKNLLRANGVLASHFPGSHIPAQAVDSVMIEIRDSATASRATLRRFRPAWLLTDGTLRSFADTAASAIAFDSTNPGYYHIVVRHRNHLAVMTKDSLALTASAVAYDFTTAMTKAYSQGANPMVSVGTRFCLFAGNGNGDGAINATDRNTIWRVQNGQVKGYYSGDFDLSSAVNATDKNLFWRLNNGAISQVP